MNYFVKHGDETWGPYSLAGLQQQLQAGKVSPDDLARSEGMADWAAISQVVGNISVPLSYTPAPEVAAASVAGVELPPNLHWSLVLVINIFAQFIPFGVLFNIGWTVMLANWARKLDGENGTLILVAMYPAGVIAGIAAEIINPETGRIAGPLLILGAVVAYIIGIFKIKAAMEHYYNYTENIFLRLSGVMTFFFSTIYLQYWINKIHKWKRTGEIP